MTIVNVISILLLYSALIVTSFDNSILSNMMSTHRCRLSSDLISIVGLKIL